MTGHRIAGPPPTWGHSHRTISEVMETHVLYQHYYRLHINRQSLNKEYMARLTDLLERCRRNNPPELWPENATDGTTPHDAA
jgi:hypothetical protein